MKNIIFSHSDTWIFLSIPLNETGTDLEGLIGTADAINHAIPTADEIEGAINRGLQTGIIEIYKNKFRLSRVFSKEVKKISQNEKIIFDVWDQLETYLQNKKWIPIKIHVHYRLKPNERNEACQRASKHLWKMYEQLKVKEKTKKRDFC